MLFIFIILGIMAGATVVISRMTNALLADKIGVYQSTFFNYATGLAVSLLLLLLMNTEQPQWSPDNNILIYLGGALGVVTIILSNLVSTKLSAFTMTLLVFISQLFTSLILDFFIYGSITPGKIIGGFLLLAGFLIYQKKGNQAADS